MSVAISIFFLPDARVGCDAHTAAVAFTLLACLCLVKGLRETRGRSRSSAGWYACAIDVSTALFRCQDETWPSSCVRRYIFVRLSGVLLTRLLASVRTAFADVVLAGRATFSGVATAWPDLRNAVMVLLDEQTTRIGSRCVPECDIESGMAWPKRHVDEGCTVYPPTPSTSHTGPSRPPGQSDTVRSRSPPVHNSAGSAPRRPTRAGGVSAKEAGPDGRPARESA